MHKLFIILMIGFVLTLIDLWCYNLAKYPDRVYVKYVLIPVIGGPLALWKCGKRK